LPGLLVLVGLLTFHGKSSHQWSHAILSVMLFLLCTCLVLLPWTIRNVRLLGASMPMGTQGAQELSAGYSDLAWNARGEWVNLAQQGFFATLPREQPFLQRELAQARLSQERGLKWMREHPFKSLALIPMKISQEFRPRTVSEMLILCLCVVGAIIDRRRPQSRIGLALVAINALAIGLTWSVGGRFLVPLLFVFHLWSGLALWSLLRWTCCHDQRATLSDGT
jgi:hypothetical protein